MRKFAIVAFLIFSLMIGAMGFAQAQTPEPQPDETASPQVEIELASLEILADTTSADGEVGMTLYRITLEPDARVPEHEHFGSVTWYISSGTLYFMVSSGEVWVRCAEDCVPGATPDASGFVLVPAGTEVELQTGDWIIQHGLTEHTYGNAGSENVVIDASTSWLLSDVPPYTPIPEGPYYLRACGGGCY